MSEPTKAEAAAKYRTVYEKLADHYGRPEWRAHLAPLDELVSTILSQATADTNRDRAYQALRKRFPSWEAVLDAPAEEVIEAIRPAGLANQKGPRIQDALRTIQAQRGELDLGFLAELPLPEAKAWLTAINGVGPKTAAIVLLFSLGRPAFPVDTHVHRVTRRLGLVGQRDSAEKAHDLLEAAGAPDTFYAMHLNLIRLGREICQARRPRCEICPLQANCDFFQRNKTGQANVL